MDKLGSIISQKTRESATAKDRKKNKRPPVYNGEGPCLEVSDLLDSFPDYAMLIDEDHFIVQANKAVMDKLGVNPETVIGRYCPKIIHGSVGPWHACPLEEAVATNTIVETEALDPTTGRWMRSVVYPIKETENGKRLFFHMVTDVTHTRKEKELREKAEEKLKQQLEIEKQLRFKLQQQVQDREEFTRALIHEIKTPLTPILGASQMLLDRLKDPDCLRMARNINRGATNLNNSVSNIFDLAKADINTLELSSKKTDMSLLIREVVEFMMPEAEKKGQIMTLELEDSIPYTWADDERLKQVILNLIDNAMKFTPQGHMINVWAGLQGNNLMVTVQDTGCGIAEKDQEQIFMPYKRRIGKKNKDNLSGLGLGLPLAKKLVELHHGQIDLQSEKGKGTLVSVSIPINTGPEMLGED